MMIRALIFDFDGLIIDSESPLFEIWRGIYAQHGHVLTLESWQHALGTQGGFDPYADLSTRLARLVERETLASLVRDRHWAACEDEPLLPGVAERLAEARAAGLATAVASSSPAAWVDPWLDRHGLRDSFDAVCTRDDVRRVKPAPDLFLLAAERVGARPAECVVFEDSPNGIRAAHAAGMRVVAVPNKLTRELALPEPYVRLESLDQMAWGELAQLLA